MNVTLHVQNTHNITILVLVFSKQLLDFQIYRSWDNCDQLVSPSSADMKYEHFSMRIVMASTTSVSADSAPVDSTETTGIGVIIVISEGEQLTDKMVFNSR